MFCMTFYLRVTWIDQLFILCLRIDTWVEYWYFGGNSIVILKQLGQRWEAFNRAVDEVDGIFCVSLISALLFQGL